MLDAAGQGCLQRLLQGLQGWLLEDPRPWLPLRLLGMFQKGQVPRPCIATTRLLDLRVSSGCSQSQVMLVLREEGSAVGDMMLLLFVWPSDQSTNITWAIVRREEFSAPPPTTSCQTY